MGSEDCKECLISFLNAVLNNTIVDIEILENLELPKETLEGKFGRLDVRAKFLDGTIINVEIQVRNEGNITERSQYYNSRLYVGSIKEGDNYRLLTRVISINILDFNYFPYKEFHISGHLRVDQHPEDILSDKQEYHFIELPKFYASKEYDITNPLHRWLTFFNQDLEKEQLEELISMDTAIRTADEKVKKVLSSEDQMRYYEAIEDARRNMITSIQFNREKGREEGREETIELVDFLIRNNRIDDLKKALHDEEFRKELYKEYTYKE